MNRNNFFVLSWGRKMFFGLGWPMLCLIALSYFQNGTLPNSALGAFYYLVTHIGHYGLITALLYFLFYVPMAATFPNYYFTRLWSMFLIMLTGLLIFIDSIVFGLYRFHFNSFILDLIVDGAGKDIFKLHPSLFIIASTIFISIMVYFWYRGERTWRSMQRRFSNPNKNWYLVLIGVFVLLSHLLHIYGDAYGNRKITRHAQNFPLHFSATAKGILGDAGLLPERIDIHDNVIKDFNYPVGPLDCPGGDDKNILFITINDWKSEKFNEVETPMLKHYMSHGHYFGKHRSGSTREHGGIFTLLYGLPEIYLKEARQDQAPPVFIDELQRRGADFGIFSEFSLSDEGLERTVFVKLTAPGISNNVNEDWRRWLESHLSRENGKPFFGLLAFASPQGADQKISEIVEGLNAKGLSKNTIIVITGTNGERIPDELDVPLLMIWPDAHFDNKEITSSHYDVVPTIMAEEWGCTNNIANYSDGQSFFNYMEKDWYLIGNEHEYQIIDYQKQQVVTVDPLRGYSVTDFELKPVARKAARTELILSVLREQARFRKKAIGKQLNYSK